MLTMLYWGGGIVAGILLGAFLVKRALRPPRRLASVPWPLTTRAVIPGIPGARYLVGVDGNQVVVADAPDADDLLNVAARRGYLMWLFRPVHGGIWKDVADDATLLPDGTRQPPCPVQPVPTAGRGTRKTVYRFGVSARVEH